MPAKKKAAARAPEAPKAEAPKDEAKAKSPIITTDSVKGNVYRVDMGESIP